MPVFDALLLSLSCLGQEQRIRHGSLSFKNHVFHENMCVMGEVDHRKRVVKKCIYQLKPGEDPRNILTLPTLSASKEIRLTVLCSGHCIMFGMYIKMNTLSFPHMLPNSPAQVLYWIPVCPPVNRGSDWRDGAGRPGESGRLHAVPPVQLFHHG